PITLLDDGTFIHHALNRHVPDSEVANTGIRLNLHRVLGFQFAGGFNLNLERAPLYGRKNVGNFAGLISSHEDEGHQDHSHQTATDNEVSFHIFFANRLLSDLYSKVEFWLHPGRPSE